MPLFLQFPQIGSLKFQTSSRLQLTVLTSSLVIPKFLGDRKESYHFADEVYGDGTFEITSFTNFSQLWVACVKVRGVTLPCFYSFLPTKEAVTYKVMFSHLKLAMGEKFPSLFLVDYDLAVILGLNNTFPESRVQCCIVHFKRAPRRKLVELELSESVD